MMTKTIAIIPAYNEAKHIAEVIKNTKKYVDEVIVIDDGSTDKTSDEAKYADAVLRHIVNIGKGLALKTGFEAVIAKGADLIVTIDADAQHDPHEIPKLIDKLKKENLDIVIGARPLNKNMPFIFKFGNWFLNRVFRLLFKQNIDDTQSGYRVIKASVYDQIKWDSSDYAVETEMLANAGKHGLRCQELPIAVKYHDSYKGTTVVDGVMIFVRMLVWKLRR